MPDQHPHPLRPNGFRRQVWCTAGRFAFFPPALRRNITPHR
jgi:hypothetical protein